MLKLTVYGTPVGKGSMKCVGKGGHHQVVPTNQTQLRPWADALTDAAAKARARGQAQRLGPVGVHAVITVARPPSNRDALPVRRSKGGDIDKQERTILDALTGGGLIRDDSQVVHIDTVTVYPDSPILVDEDDQQVGRSGRLDSPGVVLWLYDVRLVCRTCVGLGEIAGVEGWCQVCDGTGVEV